MEMEENSCFNAVYLSGILHALFYLFLTQKKKKKTDEGNEAQGDYEIAQPHPSGLHNPYCFFSTSLPPKGFFFFFFQ